MKALADTDELTGLPTRRAWERDVRLAIARAARERSHVCVAMVDIDHFKDFNDENGDAAGDQLLRAAAGAWLHALRPSDVIARYGGEEFGVILPDCDEEEALPVVERLREATPFGQTVSAGIATWEPWESVTALITRVDSALYAAKETGRDRTALAGSPHVMKKAAR